jgi:transposase
VLTHRFSWKRVSVAGVLGYAPDDSTAWLFFQLRPGAYNDEKLVEFLTELRTELNGERCILIWDGLPSHRSKTMTAFLESQRSWLVVERLPGYAHDLNPIEQVWGNAKSSELANLCPDTIDEVSKVAGDALDRIGTDADLCRSFLRHPGLTL